MKSFKEYITKSTIEKLNESEESVLGYIDVVRASIANLEAMLEKELKAKKGSIKFNVFPVNTAKSKYIDLYSTNLVKCTGEIGASLFKEITLITWGSFYKDGNIYFVPHWHFEYLNNRGSNGIEAYRYFIFNIESGEWRIEKLRGQS